MKIFTIFSNLYFGMQITITILNLPGLMDGGRVDGGKAGLTDGGKVGLKEGGKAGLTDGGKAGLMDGEAANKVCKLLAFYIVGS